MPYFWILASIPLLGLIYVACAILQTADITLTTWIPPLSSSAGSTFKNARDVRWISPKECEDLLRKSSDVIFIDLHSEPEDKSIPLSVPEALSMSRNQLFDMLRWLPDASSVVVSGASDLYTSILWLSYDIHGHAPIYLLRSGSRVECSA